MDEKFILINLNDERSKHVAEVLGNKTCKKIIDFLAKTKEASEQDIAKELNIPINTIEYNLKKLIKAGLIEKAKNFFWSIKGRKIDMYKLAKKHIVISPGTKPSLSKLKSIIPVVLISGALALFIKYFYQIGVTKTGVAEQITLAEKTAPAAEKIITAPNLWLWFLIGALVAVIIFVILNWKKL